MYLEMSDKVNLYVKQSGNGIPCVFIHGGPGGCSYDFEILGGNSLESFMKMLYFDQRGSGRSGGDANSDYSIDRIVEDIEEIRKGLGIGKWVVMAHSFGGIIAVNYVYKYQKFVDKLILLNATLNIEDSLINQIYYGYKLLHKEELQSSVFSSVLEKWQYVFNLLNEKNIFYKLQYRDYSNFAKVNDIISEIKNINTAMANQAFKNKEYFVSYFHITKEIDVPVLVIAGSEDFAIGPNHHENFIFSNERIEIIKGKHILYVENIQELKMVIKAFIENLYYLNNENAIIKWKIVKFK